LRSPVSAARVVCGSQPVALDQGVERCARFLRQHFDDKRLLGSGALGIPASIQAGRMGNSRRNDGKLAADAPGPVVWNIWVPLFALANGSVNDRDIVSHPSLLAETFVAAS
jgi:hypothetical protein